MNNSMSVHSLENRDVSRGGLGNASFSEGAPPAIRRIGSIRHHSRRSDSKPAVSSQFNHPVVAAVVAAIVVLIAGAAIHGDELGRSEYRSPANSTTRMLLCTEALEFHARVLSWQQEIAMQQDDGVACAMRVEGSPGGSNPKITCGMENAEGMPLLHLGADYILRHARPDEGVLVQHRAGRELDPVEAFTAFKAALKEEVHGLTTVRLTTKLAKTETPDGGGGGGDGASPKIFMVVFAAPAYTDISPFNCTAKVASSVETTHLTLSLGLGLALIVGGIVFALVATHAGHRSISKRMQQILDVAAAVETMDLGMLSMLRLAEGERRRNIRSALQPKQLRQFDDTIGAAIQRVVEVRKHLPQIVLQTQGTLSALLTVQATDVGAVDAKELEFGGGNSPSSDTMSSAGSPVPSNRNLMEITGPMTVSYDHNQQGSESDMIPSLSPARNPLLAKHGSASGGTVLDMVGPSDYRCYMLLKKATFVVCKLFLPDAIEEDLARLHGISQAFFRIITGIAAQFDGLVHSSKLSEIVLTWNAFRPYPFHESRGALCALHIASNMQPIEDDPLVGGEHLRWCLVVNTGVVVVSQSGSNNKLAPSIVGDSVNMAIKVAQLGPSIHSNVIVMEPSHIVARNQIFSIPIDVIGDDSWKITLFDMKGKQDEHRSTDRSGYVEGFSLFTRHRFGEAESKLFRNRTVEPQANRLLKMCRLFQAVDDLSGLIPNPYHRQVPGWDYKELEADEIDVTEILSAHASNCSSPNHNTSHNSLLSPTSASTFLHVNRPRMRRPSMLPEDYLRTEIDRVRQSPMVDISGDCSDISSDDCIKLQNPPVHDDDNDDDGRPPTSAVPIPELDPPTTAGHLNATPDRKPGAPALLLSPSILVSTPGNRLNDTLSPSFVAPGNESITSNVSGDQEDPLSWTDRRGAVWKLSGKKLGEGSFGAVFLGLAEDGELVAVKQLPIPDGDTDKNKREIEDVLTEVATISALRNEYVVRYYSSAVHMGKLVLAMEYVSGGSLSQLLNRFGALPAMSIHRYVKDILLGLKFLHAEGIVHRDINPNNVLLNVDGGCKLTDFGASKSINRLAVESDICGTPPFMAPEACRGNASTASDVWGVGVMMCHMFFGRLPWRQEDLCDVPAFLRRVAADPTFQPEIPGPKICNSTEMDFIASCLARNEDDRLTAEELLSHHFFMMN